MAIEGNFRNWLLTKIVRERLEIKRFNRQKMFEFLQIDIKHLPLLSAITKKKISYNDKINKRFRNKLCANKECGGKNMKYIIDRKFLAIDDEADDSTNFFLLH